GLFPTGGVRAWLVRAGAIPGVVFAVLPEGSIRGRRSGAARRGPVNGGRHVHRASVPGGASGGEPRPAAGRRTGGGMWLASSVQGCQQKSIWSRICQVNPPVSGCSPAVTDW